MAVATDSHRDSLIPEYTVTQYTRQRTKARSLQSMNCVYSFVGDIISQKGFFVKGFFEIEKESGLSILTAPHYYL